jgi:MFS family permease
MSRPAPGGDRHQLSPSAVRQYWTCMAIDCVGYGMYLPLSLLFFHQVTGLSLTRAGLILTVASLLGMSSNALAGALVDRYGARAVLAGGYLVRAAGFGAYALVTNQAEMLVTTTLVAFGTCSFQPAIQAFIADIARGAIRDRMIAAQRSIRNAGLGAGALIASAVISLHSTAAYHAIVLTSGAAFLVAALIVLRIPVTRPATASAPATAPPAKPGRRERGGYLTVLRNRPFVLLAAATFPVALGYMVLEVTLPVFITQVLHRPTSWAGIMYAVNTAGIALLQVPVTRALARFRRTRACALGQLIFAVAFGTYAIATTLPGGSLELADLFAGTVLFTFAELLHGATSSALTTSAAPEELRGRHLAFFQFSWTIPQAIAPAALTALLIFSPSALWLLLITGVVVSSLFLLRLEHSLPPQAVHPTLPATSLPPPATTPPATTSPPATESATAA